MPRGTRLAIIALGLTAGLASAQELPEQSVQNQGESRGQAQTGEDAAQPTTLGVRVLESEEQSEDAERQEEEARQREIEDLAAQQSMADSTEEIVRLTDDLVWLTKLQFALAFAGTGFLLYTMYLNWKSADAAIKAVQSDRAWIMNNGFEAGPASGTIDGARVTNGFGIVIKWRNAGRSPALDAKCWATHRLIRPGEAVPIFGFDFAGANVNNAIVGPDGEFSSAVRILNDEEAHMLLSRQERMIVFSVVEYADIFDARRVRRSEVCFGVDINGTELGPDGNERPRIRCEPVGPQNTVS